MDKSQAATEMLIVLAVGLIVIAIVLSYSSRQIVTVSTMKRVSQARATVEDIAKAANEVYSEGVGSRKEVFVVIPSGINESRTYVGKSASASVTTPAKSINIGVLLGNTTNDVWATTNYEVRGSLPTTPGGHWVVIVAREGYVQIGSYNLVVTPVGVSAFMHPGNITSKEITLKNEGGDNMSVLLTPSWSSTEVSLDVNESSFILTPGESKNVKITFNASSSALDVYSGTLQVNGTIGSDTDVIDVSLLAVVSVEQRTKISVYPNEWLVNLNTGMGTSKIFTVCNDFNSSKLVDLNITGNAFVSFTQQGTNLTDSMTIGKGSCSSVVVYMWVPGGTSGGEHVGYLIASSTGYSDSSRITANVTQDVYPPGITIVSPLNATYPHSWVWANLTLNETGVACWYSIDNESNQTMSEETDTKFYSNISGLNESEHKLNFYCNDTSGNIGNATINFTYAETDYPPVIMINSPENITYGHNWVWANISLNEPASLCEYSFDGNPLVRMNNTTGNTSFYELMGNLSMDQHNITFYCNDSIGQWSNETVWFTYDYVTENLTITSTSGKKCVEGCEPEDLNPPLDYSYESKLDHTSGSYDVVPMSFSNLTGANVTDVEIYVDAGYADIGWLLGYPKICSNSMWIYISNSSYPNDGTIYCEKKYTPISGDWALVCSGGSCHIENHQNATVVVFDCEDNIVDAPLDTVDKVNTMYVHIENHDKDSWYGDCALSWGYQAFRVDSVVAQVTHN
ncbi:MAG: hypothetical protein J7L23_05290 [Candidatus Diapherotrites archaeon]|nr:hypothetical protein [Candidatus Diapherotrites archaeon]